MSCMEDLAREEEETCEGIYREFARRSQLSMTGDKKASMERQVVVLGKMARADTKPRKELMTAQIRKEQRSCARLFSSSVQITADLIPFHGMESEDIVSILLSEVLGRGREVVKGRIREEVRRWHPDKFIQKLGSRLIDEEKEEIMEKVKKVSQALNVYGKLSC